MARLKVYHATGHGGFTEAGLARGDRAQAKRDRKGQAIHENEAMFGATRNAPEGQMTAKQAMERLPNGTVVKVSPTDKGTKLTAENRAKVLGTVNKQVFYPGVAKKSGDLNRGTIKTFKGNILEKGFKAPSRGAERGKAPKNTSGLTLGPRTYQSLVDLGLKKNGQNQTHFGKERNIEKGFTKRVNTIYPVSRDIPAKGGKGQSFEVLQRGTPKSVSQKKDKKD